MRIGIDWGGTKIEAIALDERGRELYRERKPTPQGDYEGSIRVAAALVEDVERRTQQKGTIGVGIPGFIDPHTGVVRNANSTWLNGRPLQRDIEAALGRPTRFENDANCLALSEATDGAGRDYAVVFAAVLGTGCGAGLAVNAQVHVGPNSVAGEWGHNPIPWPTADDDTEQKCYCGKSGCIERFLSGPAFERDYRRRSNVARSASEIVASAEEGDDAAKVVLALYEDRLARALATVINVLDPGVIVLAGGMSNIHRLYESVPALLPSYVFGGTCNTPIVPAQHGSSSGVRGAAWLWNAVSEKS